MSEKLLDLVWERFPDGGEDLLIMLALADQANDLGEAYPPLMDLAARTRMSTQQLTQRLNGLNNRGWIHNGGTCLNLKTLSQAAPREWPEE